MRSLTLTHTKHVATTIYHFESVTSTQTEARRFIADGKAHGLLIASAEQTAGRGRFGRTWQSPRGNLYLSFVLQPPPPLKLWTQCTMMAALALAEATEHVAHVHPDLKWPNDLLIDGKKFAGILAEIEGDYLIVGVGVNVNADLPIDLSEVTSLRLSTGHFLDEQELLRVFVHHFDALYDQWLQGARFERAWADRLQTLGREVRLSNGAEVIEGLAEGVTEDGALRVRCADGRQIVCHAGDVTLQL